MIEIIFQNQQDARKLQGLLELGLSSSNISSLQLKDGYAVQIKTGGLQETADLVKRAMTHFIIETKQDDWFRRILSEQYFYEDEEEQQQILDIIHSILEGNRDDLSAFLDGPGPEESLSLAIEELMTGDISSFSFDSFVKFRLRPMMDQLERYAALSIDEYKMEQEYQMFIHMLRDFLKGRAPKRSAVHLVMGEETAFYDGGLIEIKRAELLKMVDRRLLFNHPVYVDSVTIAPLLSMAPSAIYLYSDEPDCPLASTVRNIFEERVIIQPLEAFIELKKILSAAGREKI
ncbi:putative sporulation protein YtxC [Bacillus sp. UMB0728]|uniref:putative sporulation protein YtxC n=1 Tax=Bacillus sp. UMB0728 TaxID=2066052 RepID=UPI000C7797E0|nr:putative sporulation protein YtxC [Bacillus sp. UMB0728]PLR72866.1 putative sporulation protein YtxC [Bacillus sp. UMB0728]